MDSPGFIMPVKELHIEGALGLDDFGALYRGTVCPGDGGGSAQGACAGSLSSMAVSPICLLQFCLKKLYSHQKVMAAALQGA